MTYFAIVLVLELVLGLGRSEQRFEDEDDDEDAYDPKPREYVLAMTERVRLLLLYFSSGTLRDCFLYVK